MSRIVLQSTVTPEAHSNSGRGTDKSNCFLDKSNCFLPPLLYFILRLWMKHLQLCWAGAWSGDSGGAELRVVRKLRCGGNMGFPYFPVSPGISREYFLSLHPPVPPLVCCTLYTQLGWSSPCPGSSLSSTLVLLKTFGESAELFVSDFPALQRASRATEFIIFNFQSLVI